jgi:hypothetical protein
MRYIYAALAAILMAGCASSSRTAAGPDGAAAQPVQPQASAQPAPQAAAVGPTNSPADRTDAGVVEAQAKGTDTLIERSSNLKTGHQGADPVQCLMAWVERNQKSNPYLKTCDASPPGN